MLAGMNYDIGANFFNKQLSRNRLMFILLLVLLFVPGNADAVPALDDSIFATQPDGTSFQIRIYGDEFQNWQEEVVSGLTVIKNPVDGYWEYAEKAPDGTLKGSGVRVDPHGQAVPPHIPLHLKPSRNLQLEGPQQELKSIHLERLPAKSDCLEGKVDFNQPRGVDANPTDSTGGNQ